MTKGFSLKALAGALLSLCLASSAGAQVTAASQEKGCKNWAGRITFEHGVYMAGYGSSSPGTPANEVAMRASRTILVAMDARLDQILKAFPGFYETAMVVIVDAMRSGQTGVAFNERLFKECMAIPVKS